MTAAAAVKQHETTIERPDPDAPILYAAGREAIGIRAGTVIRIDGRTHAFDEDTLLDIAGTLVPGYDYGVGVHEDGRPFATVLAPANPLAAGYVAGFHFAPSGCAEGTEGGDGVPSINPHSLWDVGFRPACPDPRGMALVSLAAGWRLWADIYLLAVDHLAGTSRCGATIADGRDRPERVDGKGKCDKLDYATAVAIYAHHGKRLLGADEFFAAAYGVKERCARGEDAIKTGSLDEGGARFVSRFGLFDATGTMWIWATDGHPDDPRPSLLGGSWFYGSSAGSRYAHLDYGWPEVSSERISARGACDHLSA
ncbi:hypothetical protein [Shinella sp. BYT-45]|uniref:phage major tropism determinant n=1 Tax=Shinella sp. BYT-45 TaxID=3377377 RepID=UPI00397F41D6